MELVLSYRMTERMSADRMKKWAMSVVPVSVDGGSKLLVIEPMSEEGLKSLGPVDWEGP